MGLQNEKIAALSFVKADLNYLAPPLDRPRTYTFEPPSGEPRSNIVPEPHSLPVHDARPIEGYDRDAIVAFHVDKFKSHHVPLILDVGPRVLRGPGLWRFPEISLTVIYRE